jgi:hypothetical protein
MLALALGLADLIWTATASAAGSSVMVTVTTMKMAMATRQGQETVDLIARKIMTTTTMPTTNPCPCAYALSW